MGHDRRHGSSSYQNLDYLTNTFFITLKTSLKTNKKMHWFCRCHKHFYCYFIAFYFRFGSHKHSNKDQKGTIFSFLCNLTVSKLPSLKLMSGTFILPSLPPQNVPN